MDEVVRKLPWMALAGIGHLGIWCSVFNRMHATAWPRWIRKVLEKLVYVAVIGGGLSLVFLFVTLPFPEQVNDRLNLWGSVSVYTAVVLGYAVFCNICAVLLFFQWVVRKLAQRRDLKYVAKRSKQQLAIASRFSDNYLHGWETNILKWVPGNQVLDLAIESKELILDELPEALVGLRIVHMSDLHFTGKVDIRYFEEVVRQVNLLCPDFVCLTGDIVDEVECLPWIDQVLGQVSATHAKLFVLGNHDCRVRDERQICRLMAGNGWLHVAGGWSSFAVGESTISFAGNEAPWFKSGLNTPDRVALPNELLVLLSHSPDQIRWARQRNFKLMLAGHNHGGQVCFPIIGPVIAPSVYGAKYASGVFKQGSTLMHVSRGVSGDDPIRWNCPPEITLITLVDSLTVDRAT